jgi:hypothetical protein
MTEDYDDSLIILPFWRAIPFLLFQVGGCVSLSATVILAVSSCILTGFWASWSALALSFLILAIYAAMRHAQAKPDVRKYYFKNGACRVGFTFFQYLLATVLAIGISIGLIWTIKEIWS